MSPCKVCEKEAGESTLCEECTLLKRKLLGREPIEPNLVHPDYVIRIIYRNLIMAPYSRGSRRWTDQDTTEEKVLPLYIGIKNIDLARGRYLLSKGKYSHLYNDEEFNRYPRDIQKAKVIRKSTLVDLG